MHTNKNIKTRRNKRRMLWNIVSRTFNKKQDINNNALLLTIYITNVYTHGSKLSQSKVLPVSVSCTCYVYGTMRTLIRYFRINYMDQCITK